MRRLLICALVLLATACASEQNASLALEHARMAPPPRAIEAFELVDHTGARFSPDDLKGRWSLLFSGFVSCPDICPATLSILRTAQEKLDSSDAIRTIFVTVDPDRDTPERLAEFIGWFDESWIGVTGETEQLDRLLSSLQMGYVRVPTGGGEYTMDHATAVALIDPEGETIAWWTPPLDANELASDLRRLPAP